jgi:hypothetical protein
VRKTSFSKLCLGSLYDARVGFDSMMLIRFALTIVREAPQLYLAKIKCNIARCAIGKKGSHWDQSEGSIQYFVVHASVQYVQAVSPAEPRYAVLLDLSTAKHLFGSADC